MSTDFVGRGGRCPVLQGYDPLDPADLADPYPGLARARKEAPIFWDEKYRFWNVTKSEDIIAVLRDDRTFSSSHAIPMPPVPEEFRDRLPDWPFQTALVFMDDPAHKRNRTILQAPFLPRRLRGREEFIRERATKLLLAAKAKGGPLEFVHDFALSLALQVIGDLCGVPEADWPKLQAFIDDAFAVANVSGDVSAEELRRLAKSQVDYWEYLRGIVLDRQANPNDDFSSILSQATDPSDGSHLSVDEVAALINTVVGAGFHTSAQMMTAAFYAMLTHPDQWELLRSDRSLLDSAVEESVRYRTPVKRIYRHVIEDVEIGGVKMVAGDLVACVLASGNRDEEAHVEADALDITRFESNLTFGRGMHHCLGGPLAKTELKIAFEVFLDHAPDSKLATGQDIVRPSSVRLDTIDELFIDLT
jgi:cytochrome P450